MESASVGGTVGGRGRAVAFDPTCQQVRHWCCRLQQACAAAQNATAQQAAFARALEADRDAVRQELAQTRVAVQRLEKEVANRSAALERAAHAAEAETLRRRDGEERVCALEDQVNRLQLQVQGSGPVVDKHSHDVGSYCWVFTPRITPHRIEQRPIKPGSARSSRAWC